MIDNGTPTIITLNPEKPQAMTYEEAFGQYSNSSGHERRVARREKHGSRLGNILTGGVSGATKMAKNKHKANKAAKAASQNLGDQTDNSQSVDTSQPTPSPVDNSSQQDQEDDQGQNASTQSARQSSPQMSQSSDDQDQGGDDSEDEGDAEGDDTDDQPQDDTEYSEDEDETDGSEFSGVDGKKQCDAHVKDLSKKIVWNKEMLKRTEANNLILKKTFKVGKGLTPDKSRALSTKIKSNSDKILNCHTRISQLQDQLTAYGKANGIAKSEVVHCFKMAHKALKGGDMSKTIVDSTLDADIDPNRIVINPDQANDYSSFDSNSIAPLHGTGLIGIDNRDDYDAPEATVVEVRSNASGDASINYTAIAIGLGVAAVSIFLLNRFVFSKNSIV